MTTSAAMRMVTFRVLGEPEPQGSARAFVMGKRAIVTSDNPHLADWRHCVASVAQSLGEELFTGPIAVAVVFRFVRPKSKPRRIVHHITRPDVDKCARAILDGLTGVLFADDAAVVDLRARKTYAPEGVAPGAEITIREVREMVAFACNAPSLFDDEV